MAKAQTLYLSDRYPMQNPAKIDAAFTRVSASDDWAVVSPSADANAVRSSKRMSVGPGCQTY